MSNTTEKGIEISLLEMDLMLKLLTDEQFYYVFESCHAILGGETPKETADETTKAIVDILKLRFERGFTSGFFYKAKEQAEQEGKG